MKMLLCALVFTCFLPNSNGASLSQVSIDAKWKIKYDDSKWSYIYLKPAIGISPNIFEYKKEKIKLILQRETHSDDEKNLDRLVAKKCEDANSFYSQKKAGLAKMMKINNTNFCYVEYRNSKNESIRQFLTPEKSKNRNYDLFSYAWNSSDSKSVDIVKDFLKGFTK